MAWEQRRKRRYYYRKRWINGGAMSEYVGTGTIAELASILDEAKRFEKEALHQAWRQEQAEQNAIDHQLDDLGTLLSTYTKAILLVNGFHLHKRQWRKRHV